MDNSDRPKRRYFIRQRYAISHGPSNGGRGCRACLPFYDSRLPAWTRLVRLAAKDTKPCSESCGLLTKGEGACGMARELHASLRNRPKARNAWRRIMMIMKGNVRSYA